MERHGQEDGVHEGSPRLDVVIRLRGRGLGISLEPSSERRCGGSGGAQRWREIDGSVASSARKKN